MFITILYSFTLTIYIIFNNHILLSALSYLYLWCKLYCLRYFNNLNYFIDDYYTFDFYYECLLMHTLYNFHFMKTNEALYFMFLVIHLMIAKYAIFYPFEFYIVALLFLFFVQYPDPNNSVKVFTKFGLIFLSYWYEMIDLL